MESANPFRTGFCIGNQGYQSITGSTVKALLPQEAYLILDTPKRGLLERRASMTSFRKSMTRIHKIAFKLFLVLILRIQSEGGLNGEWGLFKILAPGGGACYRGCLNREREGLIEELLR